MLYIVQSIQITRPAKRAQLMNRKDKKPAKLQVDVNKQERAGRRRRVLSQSVGTNTKFRSDRKLMLNDDGGLESVFAVCQPHLLPSNFISRSADGPIRASSYMSCHLQVGFIAHKLDVGKDTLYMCRGKGNSGCLVSQYALIFSE